MIPEHYTMKQGYSINHCEPLMNQTKILKHITLLFVLAMQTTIHSGINFEWW